MRSSLLAIAVSLAGCSGAPVLAAAVEEPIIGGTSDTADGAVVLVYMTVPGTMGGALCTGELISPHVVLTAAHCTGGENPSVTNGVWRVYLGNDFNKATAADLRPVKAAHYHPSFNVDNLPGGNDVGVAILQNAAPSTLTPLAYNRASMEVGFDGKPVRLVGYGLDNGTAQTGAGIKRSTTTTLTDHTPMLLHFGDGAHETCNGDSGGPAFMTVGGKETIVGLTSYGDVACANGGYDTRVDAVAGWIDGYVNQADPGFLGGSPSSGPSMPPSPSGGTQPPPTSSAPPMPPSSAGAGGVGASCGSDRDCQSSLCGLGSDGARVCLAAGANQVHGGMGCALVAGAGANGGGGTTAALVLVLSLIMKLGRVRRRARR